MAAHARLKNEFTEDEKCHNLMRWLKFSFLLLLKSCKNAVPGFWNVGDDMSFAAGVERTRTKVSIFQFLLIYIRMTGIKYQK